MLLPKNARVLEAKECIINGDIKSFGNLMNESHQS
jgi:Galactokinase